MITGWHKFKDHGGSTWRIFADGAADDARHDIDWSSIGTPTSIDAITFGFKWAHDAVQPVRHKDARLVRLPEFYRLQPAEGRASRWLAVPASDVPANTGLHGARWNNPREDAPIAYETPTAANSSYQSPGPASEPIQVKLGDGSVLTYAWYRFADQPAMRNADLTDAEREEAQRRIEMLHRTWRKDRDYLAPPLTGALASIDPSLIVEPPAGLEVGHVPIAIKQERVSATTP
jgi:hypothetical protein